ncbi:hypothetical protein GCM10027515_14520 [Schumannella luteola]|uniref:Uncharacterized protein n=1 Tax=Schumannella luteola TaxID=472059 RepID=A0A852YFQ9_9MICO|nr:phage holin family protein [Schumannella luteola]NYG97898.1 hypothetical protein [Schumannella luteola]TPX03041.1 hypothetical protein FJ656_19045 [Schumannella luteola]
MSLPPQQPGQPVNPEYGRQPDPQQVPPGGGQSQQPSPWTPEAQNGGPQQAWDPAAQQQRDAQQQWMAQQQARTPQSAPGQAAPGQSWSPQPNRGIQQNWQGQLGQQPTPQQARPQQVPPPQQSWSQQHGAPQPGAQQQVWPPQAAPLPAAQPPAGPPQPISMSFGGGAGLVKGVGIGCLVVVALCAVQIVLDLVKNDPSWVALTIVGVLVGLFGVLCLMGVRNIRGAGLAIGPDGIQATLQGKTVRIAWHEIAYVGISITSSGFDGPGAPPVPSRFRGRSIIRIRLAGTTPGFTDRPDMKFLVTNDEQEPYTHKLPIAKAGALGDDRFGFIDPVARALAGFGGPRFTGVEQKRVAVGRYS